MKIPPGTAEAVTRDLTGLGGLGLVIGGVTQISTAIAMIFSGLALIAVCYVWARRAA